jgi:uncharacterized protein
MYEGEASVTTQCPACKSWNIRRSSIRGAGASSRPWLHSPYRCRDCGRRFWVVGRRAYYLAGLGGIAIVAATIAWNVVGTAGQRREEPVAEPAPETSAETSFAQTVKLAEGVDPDAEYRLSQLYAHGSGVAANKQQALAWLERAAQHGNRDAQYELGNALREGSGLLQDYAGAIKWLQLAAEHGHPDAQYALGQMYRSGMGVAVDNAKAYMWFNLAAAHEVAGAVAQRDAVLRSLSSREVLEAQAEARHLSEPLDKQSAAAR